ncbi:MAG TPA: hypothetical protein VJ385_18480 [Fibrobacteria bacterium]|nr:hypothetical protein [Fibrobacteria bacterium]
MNKFPSPLLPYAETHYKFKLPWSPLHKEWPEIFLDGPSFCVPGVKPVFYLAIKDADLFPVRILEIEVLIQGEGLSRKLNLPLEVQASENLRFVPLALDFSGLHGTLSLNGRITVEKPNGESRTFLNANFPGISPSPLRLHLLSAPLPYPADWHAGELHCHSDYSNDPVEFGAPLQVLQEAGKALGMGYVVCTDHSYDFYYDKRRYMQRIDPDANFQAYRREALELNRLNAGEGTLLIPGEEVSCGNHLGENVHLLVAGHAEFLPGLGDGGRRWFNNKPDLRVEEILERLGEVPGFAAHPRSRVGTLERLIFRRGMWHDQDLRPSAGGRTVDGLQFWNGHRGRDFSEGREFWIARLLAGQRISPIGANDAHGDLNRNIGVKTPLFSLYQNRNHVFGHVRTVVHSADKTVAGIQAGLKSGRLFCTDGPFLHLRGAEGSVELRGASLDDFGGFAKVSVLAGTRGETRERPVREWSWDGRGPVDFSETVRIPAGAAYVRAEARTEGKRFALTAPVYPS